jgi:ABC-type molybdenum transport system ATPase subunit/photorepair protein PhrA
MEQTRLGRFLTRNEYPNYLIVRISKPGPSFILRPASLSAKIALARRLEANMHRRAKIVQEPLALITTIEINHLFGRYSYNLEMPLSKDANFAPLNMIYGDNGTGKTTILKLIYHLLSAADKRGHRTFIARVPFSQFKIIFSNRTEVSAIRKKVPHQVRIY